MLIVTATDLPRLMACNGSRLMMGSLPVVERDDTVRMEGNAAHWLVEQIYAGLHTAEELVDRKAPNGIYITPEMVEHLDRYLQADHGIDTTIEQDYNITGEGWQVNGRWDRARYTAHDFTLYIDDLKYGWSIVEPERHWTLIANAIGWMIRYGATHRVDRIVFTVFQPRPYHPLGTVRSWEINQIALTGQCLQIGETLSAPNDQLNTGQHCYKCPALAFCPAARKAQLNAIEASEKAFVDKIDNTALSFQLDHLTRAMTMLKQSYDAYAELAEHRIKAGENVTNYALERGMSNYHFPDHLTVEIMQGITGKDLRKNDIMTPAQAIKHGVPKEAVDALKTRHETGTKLVRVDLNAKASKTFKK